MQRRDGGREEGKEEGGNPHRCTYVTYLECLFGVLDSDSTLTPLCSLTLWGIPLWNNRPCTLSFQQTIPQVPRQGWESAQSTYGGEGQNIEAEKEEERKEKPSIEDEKRKTRITTNTP